MAVAVSEGAVYVVYADVRGAGGQDNLFLAVSTDGVNFEESEIVENDGEHRAELTLGQSYNRQAGVEHDVINAGSAELVFVEVEIKAHGIE